MIVRLATLTLTGLVLWALFTDKHFSSLNGLSMREIFWLVLMPGVVVLIYLSPMLWRNICPLATVNLWHFSLFGRRRLCQGKSTLHQCSTPMKKVHDFLRKKGLFASALLFWIIVPARLFLFNGSSLATFWMIVTVFTLAFVMGFFFPVKSGWCTSICPMSAIEKTYGLNPAVAMKNTRCHFYSEAQNRVLSCSGCSSNCGDVVDPEHAYWQASGNKLFHDTVNARMRKIFIGTLPAFMLSFYLMANQILVVPKGSMGWQAMFVYGIFAFSMVCSYVLYAGIKSLLRAMAEQREGSLDLDRPSVLYVSYKRRLDLVFVAVIMNIIWFASSRALVYKIIAKVLPDISADTLLGIWLSAIGVFFLVSVFSLWNGWKETPGPGHYKPSWW